MSSTEQAEREYTFRLNHIADQWGSMTRRDMLANARASGISAPAGKVKNVNSQNSGRVDRIGFRFPRYLVFVEMGVFGGLSKDQAVAQGKLDPREWFNPALEKNLPELEDKLLDAFPDLVINAMRSQIKNTSS